MARRGASLSVKMIVTTTMLIVVTVVGSGLLNVFNIRGVFDDASLERTKAFREGRELLGEVGTPLFAQAVQNMLVDRGQDLAIKKLVEGTLAQDTKDVDGAKDYGLRFAFVLDPSRQLVAHCIEDPVATCTKNPPNQHLPLTAAPPMAATVFQQALTAWKAAPPTGPGLVKLDLTDGDARYRVFAYPVVSRAISSATAGDAAAEPAPDDRLGYVVLGYDLAPIARFEATTEQQKSEASQRAAIYSAAVGALFALIGTVLAILQGLSISRPIKQLAWKADQIARGDLEARVEVKSNDEIGFLGENFNFMADQIAILLQQTAEKARIEQELEVARAIQETLVPTSDPVDRDVLKFAGFYQPAAQTGGDWWTWHELPGNKILLVIGDVTGHGVPSAMITAAAKAACDVARHIYDAEVTVSRLLEIMNHAIYESAQRRFVMTCFASIVDLKARTITYANAGHNFPYLFRQGDGKGEFGSLMIRGNRLGDDQTSRYEAKTTDLLPGDVLVWYTDGIVECENEAGEEYGEKRFRASVRRSAALDAGEMRDAIVGEATTFFGEAPRKDDITMIVGRVN
jgi:serine phosphatase RsbU (regulator of sigma subunit)